MANNQKSQIVFVHGGDSFDTDEEFFAALESYSYNPYAPERKRWRDALAEVTAATHDFLYIKMPNKENADYEAWEIWFDKVVPYLRDGAVLIGHSLGGGFYLRYLTEHKLPVTIAQLHLVAPVIDDIDCPGIGGFKIDPTNWPGFESEIGEVHLWHSDDDTIVPIHQSERFKEIYPRAHPHRFADRGHFLTETFPELEETILIIK